MFYINVNIHFIKKWMVQNITIAKQTTTTHGHRSTASTDTFVMAASITTLTFMHNTYLYRRFITSIAKLEIYFDFNGQTSHFKFNSTSNFTYNIQPIILMLQINKLCRILKVKSNSFDHKSQNIPQLVHLEEQVSCWYYIEFHSSSNGVDSSDKTAPKCAWNKLNLNPTYPIRMDNCTKK